MLLTGLALLYQASEYLGGRINNAIGGRG
jgi:hypothetical protein